MPVVAMALDNGTGYKTFDDTDLTRRPVSNTVDNNTAAKLFQDGATYTMEEAIEKVGFGRFQIKLSIIAGMAWIADSMELMVLSILGPVLLCQWRLSATQEALITTAVFIGFSIGSPFIGWFADRYGRKTCLMFAASWAACFGILSSLSPFYTWLLVLRTLTGVGLSGVPQAVTYYSEFLPSKFRGKCIVLLNIFWALGSTFEVILAILILQPLGWRWWLVISALPLIIFVPSCLAFPESAYYLMACGRYNEAQKTLEEVAKCNKTSLPEGKLKVTPELPRASLKDLFTPEYRRSTPLLWVVWFCCFSCYYGTILLTTELIRADTACITGGSIPLMDPENTCKAGCKTLTQENYIQLLWTSVAELPALVLTAIYVDNMGRKTALMINFSLYSLTLCVLFICANKTVTIFLLFVARAFAASFQQIVFIYTPELYPTVIRALGMGCAGIFARTGALITPFIAVVLVRTSLAGTLGVYGGLGIIGLIAVILLPIETRGRDMQVAAH